MLKGTRQLRAMLEAMASAVITTNDRGMIESINPFASLLFGYTQEELLDQDVAMLMPRTSAAEHFKYIKRYMRTGQKRVIGVGLDLMGRHKNGAEFPVHIAVGEFAFEGQTYFVAIINDLSKQKKAEAALVRAQKNEAIGRLSGGIAHDFNNILTVIMGSLELLGLKDLDDDSQHLVNEALNSAELGSQLASRLLTFARKTVLEPRTVNVNDEITSVTDIVSRTLGGTIEFSTRLADDIWPCRIDPAQLESALLNLALNSRDAMPEGGRLVVETKNIAVDANFTAGEVELELGEYVALSVSDTGCGMDEHQRQRAFDPFFTTKPAGKGTGLGLSVLRGFVQQSGGVVSIYSQPGYGTTVTIYLPSVHQGGLQPVILPAISASIDSGLEGECAKQKLILVVDDEPKLLALATERLLHLGFQTIKATSALEAVERLSTVPDIDLVFTDIAMPGDMSGYDLASLVKQDFPDIPVLMTSGFAEDAVHSEKLSELSVDLLRKPYRLDELHIAILKTLGSPG